MQHHPTSNPNAITSSASLSALSDATHQVPSYTHTIDRPIPRFTRFTPYPHTAPAHMHQRSKGRVSLTHRRARLPISPFSSDHLPSPVGLHLAPSHTLLRTPPRLVVVVPLNCPRPPILQGPTEAKWRCILEGGTVIVGRAAFNGQSRGYCSK